jgi:geranylgeranyl diphosphate synthase type II
MDNSERIEAALELAIAAQEAPEGPPRLAAAIRHSVFPGGARIRPHLTLAVAQACGADDIGLAAAAGAAIELMHCASLVHDDLPCFDNATTRRGRPSVFGAYGERLAVLAGDALIVTAFQSLALAASQKPDRMGPLLSTLATGVAAPSGIVAGQAWECEPRVALTAYQRAKTGALFVASTCAGAQATGADPRGWRALGEYLGEAYQVADDIRDVMLNSTELGKPAGQDAQHQRPSAAADLGLLGAVDHFRGLMQHAVDSIPDCTSRSALRHLVWQESERLMPQSTCDRIQQSHGAAARLTPASVRAPVRGAVV